jgi:ATP-binding cassette subfamily B protein
VIITIVVALVGLAAPWPMTLLVDSVLGDHPLPAIVAQLFGWLADDRFTLLVFLVLTGLVITLVANGLNVLNEYVQARLTQYMVLDFRSELLRHTHSLSLAFHHRRRSGQLVYAINYQANALPELILMILPLGQSILTIVGMFWISFLIDRKLALLSLVVMPFLYYSVGYYAVHIQERLTRVKEMEGETISITHEAMSMLQVIVAFGREAYEHRRYRNQCQIAAGARISVTMRQTVFSLVVGMITATGTALVLGFGAYGALQGQITVGQLLVVLGYIGSIYKPLETISTSLGSLQEQVAGLKIAFDLLDTPVEVEERWYAQPIERARGQLNFEAVHFSYSGRAETLTDIWLEVPAGQVVAIVGPTGAGKTTLVSLIPRFYDVRHGSILLDGRSIRLLTLQSLREQISIVLQEPLLFSGSIADNIRYGKLDATMDDIVAAAQAANAHDFIMRLPRQYATQVGERGVQLSGGERQRICIARAFLKDAPVLILDEPTSSIDSKTEAGILEALERLMIGRTTLLVAHRLSTIRHADQIVVLDRGQLVEQGSHEALMRRQGLYRQLYELQFGSVHSSGRTIGQPSLSTSE